MNSLNCALMHEKSQYWKIHQFDLVSLVKRPRTQKSNPAAGITGYDLQVFSWEKKDNKKKKLNLFSIFMPHTHTS